MPVRLFAENPPAPTSNCRLRQQGAEYTLANTHAVMTHEQGFQYINWYLAAKTEQFRILYAEMSWTQFIVDASNKILEFDMYRQESVSYTHLRAHETRRHL
eukprot:1213063-Prorocentrum_lima.AAC.1